MTSSLSDNTRTVSRSIKSDWDIVLPFQESSEFGVVA